MPLNFCSLQSREMTHVDRSHSVSEGTYRVGGCYYDVLVVPTGIRDLFLRSTVLRTITETTTRPVVSTVPVISAVQETKQSDYIYVLASSTKR